jgi:methylmalonyl-CoA mutase C-terminal domain/subunit
MITAQDAPRTTIRVLIAKPGLDGHDVGAKVVCRKLRDAGMEVVYTGLRQAPEAIARTAVAEDVDVLGLSILSGAHMPLCRKVADDLRTSGAREDLVWIVGGNIPRPDHETLRRLGVAAVFPTGAPLDGIVDFIRERVRS